MLLMELCNVLGAISYSTNLFSLMSIEKSNTKPSPSKRRCSENAEVPISNSENAYPNHSSSITCVPPGMDPTSQLVAPSTENEEQDPKSEPVAVASVKTRMQKLAEQRRGWDSGGMCFTLNCTCT